MPYLALSAAFCFVIQMFNIPMPGGTTGHITGGALVGIVLGPWMALLALSITLFIQALLFGDGGITTFGANCFNMAFAMPLCAFAIFRLFRGKGTRRGLMMASALAGYLSIVGAALLVGLELGLQPLLEHTEDGTPLYAPYSWRVAIPAMLLPHLLLAGPLEALITASVVAYLYRAEPTLLKIHEHVNQEGSP